MKLFDKIKEYMDPQKEQTVNIVLAVLAICFLFGAVLSSRHDARLLREAKRAEEEATWEKVVVAETTAITEAETQIPEPTEETESLEAETEENEYANLAVAQVDHYVNVRSGASTEFDIVGKMYNGSVAEILEEVDGEDGLWFHVLSGNVDGFIKAEFFLYGDDLISRVDEFLQHYAVVEVTRLNVRKEPDVESQRIGYVDAGEKVTVIADLGDWLQVTYGNDRTGYVAAEYVTVIEEYITAKTIEEEAAELEAQRVQNERDRNYDTASVSQSTENSTTQKNDQTIDTSQVGGTDDTTQNDSEVVNSELSGDQTIDQTVTEENAEDLTAVADQTAGYNTNSELRSAIIQYALQYVGYPYVHGGQSLATGTDCSGFTSYVYREFGYSLSRTPSGQYKGNGRSVSLAEAQPGDIICYGSGSCTHVALYIGNGQIVHEANKTKGCIISGINFMNILGVKNVID